MCLSFSSTLKILVFPPFYLINRLLHAWPIEKLSIAVDFYLRKCQWLVHIPSYEKLTHRFSQVLPFVHKQHRRPTVFQKWFWVSVFRKEPNLPFSNNLLWIKPPLWIQWIKWDEDHSYAAAIPEHLHSHHPVGSHSIRNYFILSQAIGSFSPLLITIYSIQLEIPGIESTTLNARDQHHFK